MKKIAIFPGTFDPFTLGHLDIVKRGGRLFDSVLVAVAIGTHKSPKVSFDKRLSLIESVLNPLDYAKAVPLDGLLIDCAKRHNATFLLRGVRDVKDYEYERPLANMNRMLDPEYDLETIVLNARPEHADVSSTLIRDILANGGDISRFVPPEIAQGYTLEE